MRSDCRWQAYLCSSQDESLCEKARHWSGSQSTNWVRILRRVRAPGNCQTVAYVVVLWRDLMILIGRVADSAFQ
jgi:hypothetical protein